LTQTPEQEAVPDGQEHTPFIQDAPIEHALEQLPQ